MLSHTSWARTTRLASERPVFVAKSVAGVTPEATRVVGTGRMPISRAVSGRESVARPALKLRRSCAEAVCTSPVTTCRNINGSPAWQKRCSVRKTLVTVPLEPETGWLPTAPNPSHRPVVPLQIKGFPVQQTVFRRSGCSRSRGRAALAVARFGKGSRP